MRRAIVIIAAALLAALFAWPAAPAVAEEAKPQVTEAKSYEIIDQDGNVILETNYDYFNYLDSGRYWVGQGNTLMLMDENGNELYRLEN